MARICNRLTLQLTKKLNGTWTKPRTNYCVSKDDKLVILKSFKQLKFLDKFAANLSKSMNLVQRNFVSLKSHDYHWMTSVS
jgi:hypothetical protein